MVPQSSRRLWYWLALSVHATAQGPNASGYNQNIDTPPPFEPRDRHSTLRIDVIDYMHAQEECDASRLAQHPDAAKKWSQISEELTLWEEICKATNAH